MIFALVLIAQPMPGSDLATVQKALEGKEYFVELAPFPGAEPKGGHAAIIVVRPLAQVLAVVRDLDHYKDVFSNFVESSVTERVGKQTRAHMAVQLDISMAGIGKLWADVVYMERTEGDTTYSRLRMLPGKGSFTRFDLDVRLKPLPPVEGKERTLVELWSMALPDIPLVPQSVLEHENQQAARRGVRAIRLRTLGVPYTPHDL